MHIPRAIDLSNDQIVLAKVQQSHWSELCRIFSDPTVMRHLAAYFGRDIWSIDDMRERCERNDKLEDQDLVRMFTVIRKSDQSIVGTCGIKNIDVPNKCAEFGIILDQSTWGQGISYACHKLCLDYFFQLGFQMIYFKTTPDNERMKGFFAKHKISLIDSGLDAYRYEVTSSAWLS